MLEEVKVLLGAAASNYTDAQIGLAAKMAMAWVEDYCKRDLDYSLTLIAERIAVIYLNKQGAEGLSSESFSGISQTYLDDLPADLLSVLNRKRKIKVV